MSISRYMFLFTLILTFFMATFAGAGNLPYDLFPKMEKSAFTDDKQPLWLHGDLGSLNTTESAASSRSSAMLMSPNTLEASVKQYIQERQQFFQLTSDDDIKITKSSEDSLGITHIRISQTHLGLPVEGADARLHVDANGKVRTMNGYLAGNILQDTNPNLGSEEALEIVKTHLNASTIDLLEPPVLVYRAARNTETRLTWKILLNWSNANDSFQDKLYVDAENGQIIKRIGLFHNAIYRKIYNGNNKTSTPGTLMFTEGESSSDSIAMDVYNNAGTVYNYMDDVLDRDSFDGNGAHLRVMVHYGNRYNNARWLPREKMLAFGDGDGKDYGPLGGALDIFAHEMFHGVTSSTGNMEYQGESGALNEGVSDIFGAACEAWNDGNINTDTWKMGEDVYTPGKSGDALRYMNDPTKDKEQNGNTYYSRDYYPDRYKGTGDYGGVHLNSGILNLSFYLLVSGGTHPRGKTTNSVPGIGLAKSQKIFYRALTEYLTETSDFEAARRVTAQAAKDLYGDSEAKSVHAAWDAVGVPGGSPPSITKLVNNDTKSNLSASEKNELHFYIDIPEEAFDLKFQIAGGSGDADIYVRFGSQPTSSKYDYRPYDDGNNETVEVAPLKPGRWYVMLRAYKTFSSVRLSVSYQTDVDPPECSIIYSNDFESGANGWAFSNADSTSTTGDWTVGVPDRVVYSNVVTQLGEDHTSSGKNAFFTAPNHGGAGSDDVDGGVCTAYSDIIDLSDYPQVEVSLWYYHGQRDQGDDRYGDYFRIDLSKNGGSTYSTRLVSIGDVKTNAEWTQVTLRVDNPDQLQFRVQASDGTANGDLVEGGIDDVLICVPE